MCVYACVCVCERERERERVRERKERGRIPSLLFIVCRYRIVLPHTNTQLFPPSLAPCRAVDGWRQTKEKNEKELIVRIFFGGGDGVHGLIYVLCAHTHIFTYSYQFRSFASQSQYIYGETEHTHTHTHIYIYIYIYGFVACVYPPSFRPASLSHARAREASAESLRGEEGVSGNFPKLRFGEFGIDICIVCMFEEPVGSPGHAISREDESLAHTRLREAHIFELLYKRRVRVGRSECLGERIISLVVCTFITGSSTASIGAGVGASCLCVEACEHVENVVQLLLEAFDAAVYCRGLQRAEELGRAHSTDIDAFVLVFGVRHIFIVIVILICRGVVILCILAFSSPSRLGKHFADGLHDFLSARCALCLLAWFRNNSIICFFLPTFHYYYTVYVCAHHTYAIG